MIRLEWPWMLLALLVPLVLALRAARRRGKRAAVLWVRTPEGGPRAWGVRVTAWLPWIAATLALLSLARPQRGLVQSETEARGVDIVIALDISPSMMAEDFRPLNRLHVAKETARDFIRSRRHDRIGLVGFAATSFTQSPLTLEHDALLELLEGLDFGLAEDGTAIGMGLATSVARLRESRSPSRVVILLTDGQNNRGAIDPLTAAELASALGVRVYTVLVGRGGVVPVPFDDPLLGRRIEYVRMDVDETVLREIARRTGGRFFRAVDPAALSQIYAAIDRLERAPVRARVYREWQELGPLVLAAAAALVAAHALASGTIAFRLP